MRIVVMGPSGSGKSTVGELLAERLGLPFVDADSLHSAANVDKMASGIPLNNDDRWPWLAAVGAALHTAAHPGMVMACSALKRVYRDAIRSEAADARFVLLDGSPELLRRRMDAREGHFMPPALLATQLQALEPLEPGENGVTVSIDQTPAEIVAAAIAALQEHPQPSPTAAQPAESTLDR